MNPTPEVNYTVQMIDIDIIFCDNNFNCRGVIAPFEVADLATSMAQGGLKTPITVQPADDVKDSVLPVGSKFRIVAGHRRYTAAKVLGWRQVPCFVRGGLNITDALVENLIENFQRADLNILQEARAIKHLMEAGIARETVGKHIGKSGGWVQNRFCVLKLPEQIQNEIAAGFINQNQIKELTSLPFASDEQYEAVRIIKEARAKGEAAPRVGKRKLLKTNTKKRREPAELYKMMDVIAGSSIKYGVATRCLAWAAGGIQTDELFADLKALDPDIDIPVEF